MTTQWQSAHAARALRTLRTRHALWATLLLGAVTSACGDEGSSTGSPSSGNVSGSAGASVRDGVDGKDGKDGENGNDGSDGENGTNGVDGENGADGQDGEDGTDGADGQDGTDGEDGTDAPVYGPAVIFVGTPKKTQVTIRPSTFTFGSSAGDSTYVCSLDGADYAPCESPVTIPRVSAGEHTFKVKATAVGDTLEGPITSFTWTAKRPNILSIVADDLGTSDIGALGGEIDTPNLDALIANGRVLRNHHVGAVCAITRAMLISGTDNHRVGEGTMGAPNDERAGLPGYEGYLNDRSLSVAQLLKDGGYHTYIAGKWHLGSRIVGGTTGSGKTADQWGFERSFNVLGGAAGNHYMHEGPNSTAFTYDGAYSRPGTPGYPEGEFATDYYTDKLIQFIDEGRAQDSSKPFYAFAAYTAPHWPLQAPEPWLSKYKGKYDKGYGPIAAARLARQQARGQFPYSITPSPGFPEALTRSPATANNGTAAAKYINAIHSPADGYVDYGQGPVIKDWDSLTPLEKKAQARYMEIYAAMVDHLDYSVGRLIQHLKDIGEYENTFIIFHSDSGAEGWPNGSGIDPLAGDESYASDAIFPTLGTDNGTANARRLQYGIRWAEVSNTPHSQVKGFQGAGGLTAPAIVHLPGQEEGLPDIRHFTHVTDDTATFLDLADVTPPSEPAPALIDEVTGENKNAGKVIYDSRYVYPVTGHSLLPAITADVPGPIHTQAFGGESYGRAFILSADGRWRARFTEPPLGPVDGHWELFDIVADPGETNDLSAQYPDLVADLIEQWKAYLASVGGVEPLRPRGYY